MRRLPWYVLCCMTYAVVSAVFLVGVQKSDFTTNLHAENLVSAPVSSAPHSLTQTDETYQNKRRQYLCKVCSAFSDKQHRSFETSYFCEACTRERGGRVALCNRIHPGQTITCTQIWHDTWKDGSLIHNDLRKKIVLESVSATTQRRAKVRVKKNKLNTRTFALCLLFSYRCATRAPRARRKYLPICCLHHSFD